MKKGYSKALIQRISDRFSSRVALSPPVSQLPGYKTYVREKSEDGLPTDSDRIRQVNLPPSAATPRSPTRPDSNKKDNLKHLGPASFNVPDGTADEIKSRTRPAEGEQYGHPYNDQITNFRVLRDVRTSSVPSSVVIKVAAMWLEGKLRPIQRRHINQKGRLNTTYQFDRPWRPQNRQAPKDYFKDRRRYRRQKPKIKLYNRLRYKMKLRNKPKFKMKQKKDKGRDTTRKTPNRPLAERNQKTYEQRSKSKRRASSQEVALKWLRRNYA